MRLAAVRAPSAAMDVYCSRLAPTGHVVVMRLPAGATFTALYSDDGSVRDITGFAANLLLTGALDVLEVADSGRPVPADTVVAAQIAYQEQPAELGAARLDASFSWVHLPSGEGGDFPPEDVGGLLARGLAVEVTAAAAKEAVDVPDDPSQLATDRRP